MGLRKTTLWEYPFTDESWGVKTAEVIATIHEGRRPIRNAADAVASMSVIERVHQGARE